MGPKMFGRNVVRVVAAAAVLGMSVSVGAGSAFAEKPVVPPGAAPPAGNAAPPGATERNANSVCPIGTVWGGDGPTIPTPQRALDLPHAWQFSKGAGQLVAVIDTGVARHPRLPGLIAGGDYVSNSDGTEDCDSHGTVVAGIIAASEEPGQGFAGVAPEAQILTIRQTSSQYQEKGKSREQAPDAMPEGYGNTNTLASAVRRSADMGASVINISEVACRAEIEDASLGAAVRYAALEKNVVVVAAAGNNDKCKGTNPVLDPLDPAADPWSKVNMNVSPARYDDYVLSVGSIDRNGQPSKFTVPGPWVGVAAPGEDITSLDVHFNEGGSKGTIVGTVSPQGQGQQAQLQGTSFAAPYVSGVAALIRSRFPELSALEVIQRIEATAHAPAEGWNPFLGYGAVDPVAALTAQVPNQLPPKHPSPAKSLQLPVPQAPPPPDNTARNVALIGTGVIGLLLVLGYLASFPIRRRLGVRED
ncbi:type VII secretion-associated serine protease mycosin [Nocardia mexicana]|nr:type VII secretion-associated serine protease mycosin [Nocardia mexicana]